MIQQVSLPVVARTGALVHGTNEVSHSVAAHAAPNHPHDAIEMCTAAVEPSDQIRRRLRVNFLWTLAGNAVYAGCQWGMLIALAKLGNTAMVGEFSLGLAVCAPVFMFSNLNLRGVQATDARGEYEFSDYLGLRLLTTLLALAVVTCVAFGTDYGRAMAAVVLLIGLAKAFESVSDVYYGRLQQHEEMGRVARSMMLRGVLALGLMTSAVLLTHSVVVAAVGIAVAWGIILAAYDVRLPEGLRGGPPSWRPKALALLSWLALPLGIVLALISLNTNLPRYFVQQSLGIAELGVFSALGYLTVASGMVVGALGQAATPQLAQRFASGDRRGFNRLLLQLVGIGLLFGVGAVGAVAAAGCLILTVVYRPEYAQHTDLLVWLMAAAVPGHIVSLLGCGLTAARAFRVQPLLFLATVAITCFACWILVPRSGLIGAAQAILIAACCQMLAFVGVIGLFYWQKGERAI